MHRFTKLIPPELKGLSGAVFNSGRDAYSGSSGLYLLGLNPGGDPAKHVRETVEFHTDKVLSRPSNWCEHRDEPWDQRPPGTAGMQPRVLHVLRGLQLDPGRVPSSNVVFVRTKGQAQIASDFGRLAALCWPLHSAVIESLQVRTVLCFGKAAGNFVRSMIAANRPIGTFVEMNNRRWTCDAYENSAGLAVVVATHPSRVAWTNRATDPTQLLRDVMARPMV